MDQNSEPSLSLQQLFNAIANAKFPKKWGKVDKSMIYYRTGTWKEAPHFGLTDENAFKLFWEDWSNQREGNEVQLVVYTKQRSSTPGNIPDHNLLYLLFKCKFINQSFPF